MKINTFLALLALLFIGLKLTGHIAWSWWLVLLPLWLPGLVALVLVIGGAIVISHFKNGGQRR